MLKQYGIYVNPERDYLSIITDIDTKEAFGIDIPIYEFEKLTNLEVNCWVIKHRKNWEEYARAFHVDLNEFPDIFKEYVYLGAAS